MIAAEYLPWLLTYGVKMDIFTVLGGPVPPAAAPGNLDCVGVLDSEGMLEPLRAPGDFGLSGTSQSEGRGAAKWMLRYHERVAPF